MTQRRRRILAWVAAVLAALLLAREFGVFDLDVYGERHTLNQTVTVNRKAGTEKVGSLQLRIVQDGEVVREVLHAGVGAELAATFELAMEIEGATWMPFYKSLTVRYSGTLRTGSDAVTGDAEGTLQMRIVGACVGRTAEALVHRAVLDSLAESLAKQLTD
ncbi:MAG: hypothetical protein KDE27_23430 [Planctomycetes bacterium]|nr:hypothetical protein [Planctomycetota bacterium]